MAASEDRILGMIQSAEWELWSMPSGPHRFWSEIKTSPSRWSSRWGEFWVVAVIGETCVHYNDIEEGWNVGRYSTYGTIAEVGYGQNDDLASFIAALHSGFIARLEREF